MLETLLQIARWSRAALYRLSTARVLGIDVDIVLHFGFGALIYAWAERRMGSRRAALLLGGLILSKEIADLFLKSSIRYITKPSLPMILDIVTDIITGIAGGLAAHLYRRGQKPQLSASSPGS
jgi:hypothetical protein